MSETDAAMAGEGPEVVTVPVDAATAEAAESVPQSSASSVVIVQYSSEDQLKLLTPLIEKDLSEPYSVYTYRYFIHNWPQLCFLVCRRGRLCY